MAPQLMLFGITTVLLTLQVSSKSIDRCPAAVRGPSDNELRVHGGMCYQFSLYHELDFNDAKQSCENKGGILAVAKTKDTNRYLLNTLKNDFNYQGGSNKIWIGLSDQGIGNEGFYQWEDGTILDTNGFANWATNQGPLGSAHSQDTQDCVAMSTINGEWSDFTCVNSDQFSTVSRPYICQYVATGQVGGPTAMPITVNTALVHEKHCPADLMRGRLNYARVFGDICYLFVLDYEQEYNLAEQECEKYKGTLAISTSADINDFLSKTLLYHFGYPERVWIGLHDQGKTHEGHYDWQDGTHLNGTGYTNWGQNQGPLGSSHVSDSEDCVAMDPNDGMWYDQHCDSSDSDVHWPRSFICQTLTEEAAAATTPKPTTPTTTPTTTSTTTTTTPKPTPTTTVKPSPVTMICPNDLAHVIDSLRVHDDVCYQFITGTKMNYNDAKQACKNYEGVLVSVKTPVINSFIVNTLKNDFNFNDNSVWIGLNDIGQTGQYHWEDGSGLSSYTNWGAQQGAAHPSGEYCISLNVKDQGKWYDHPCQGSGPFVAVCQYAKAIQTIGGRQTTAKTAR